MYCLFILTFLFSSCDQHFEEEELYGYYSPVGYKNNFDTIQLMPQGVYHRKVYDKNNKLLLESDGKWKLENKSAVHFDSFYLNFDDDLVKFPDNVKDSSAGWRGSLESRDNAIEFCVGHYQGENCYRKVK